MRNLKCQEIHFFMNCFCIFKLFTRKQQLYIKKNYIHRRIKLHTVEKKFRKKTRTKNNYIFRSCIAIPFYNCFHTSYTYSVNVYKRKYQLWKWKRFLQRDTEKFIFGLIKAGVVDRIYKRLRNIFSVLCHFE